MEHVRELEMNAAIAVFVYHDAVCQVHEDFTGQRFEALILCKGGRRGAPCKCRLKITPVPHSARPMCPQTQWSAVHNQPSYPGIPVGGFPCLLQSNRLSYHQQNDVLHLEFCRFCTGLSKRLVTVHFVHSNLCTEMAKQRFRACLSRVYHAETA